MNKYQNKKDKKLGMSFSTASSFLRKTILFSFVQKLNLDGCYRCGHKIEHIDDFTIEHKNHWMAASDPKKAFFDLSNIGFSHTRCNSTSKSKDYIGQTGFKGVTLDRHRRLPYKFAFQHNGKRLFSKHYATAKEAALAYDTFIEKLGHPRPSTNKELGLL